MPAKNFNGSPGGLTAHLIDNSQGLKTIPYFNETTNDPLGGYSFGDFAWNNNLSLETLTGTVIKTYSEEISITQIEALNLSLNTQDMKTQTLNI